MTIKRSKILLVIAVLSITLITAIAIPFSLIRAESAPNDMDYETKNLVPNLGYTFIQQGTCPYYYDTVNRSIHFNIGSPYTAGNFIYSSEKIQLKPNTKYTLTYKVESTKPIKKTVIYLANNGVATDWLNMSNWYEFTTAPDTQFVQLYFYPDLEFKNVDFKLTISDLMIYEGSNDGRPYEPKGGWYWAGVEDTYTIGKNVLYPDLIYDHAIGESATMRTYLSKEIPLAPFVEYRVDISGYQGESTLHYEIYYYDTKGKKVDWDLLGYDDKGQQVVFLVSLAVSKDDPYEIVYMSDETHRRYYILFYSNGFTPTDVKEHLRLNTIGFTDGVPTANIYDSIYKLAYNKGQREGIKLREDAIDIIPNLLGGAGDLLKSFLDYEIFGISLLKLFASLAVVIVIIWLIKSFKG